MTHLLYGAVVLAATTPLEPFPMFNDAGTINGNVDQGRYRGVYSLLMPNAVEKHIAMPQRDKYMLVYVFSDPLRASAIADSLARSLPDLDSRFEDARQLYKSQQLMNEIDVPSHPPYVAVINNVREHPFLNILVQGVPFFLIGVFDTVNRSVRIVFTTDDKFIEKVKAHDFTRYVFYRFAPIVDRPLFLHMQTLCSRWYALSKAFRGPDAVLRCFNILEHFLLKDPNIQQL